MHDEQHEIEIRTGVRAGDDDSGVLGSGHIVAPGGGLAGSGH